MNPECFREFSADTSAIPLPDHFTYPFYYEPHPLVEVAALELQKDIKGREWGHNFGLEGDAEGMVIGKMFGVLIVRLLTGKIGFLAAFSGKLAGVNHHEGFVPPVFDMLEEGSFFRIEEEHLNALTREIESLANDPLFLQMQLELEAFVMKRASEQDQLKAQFKDARNQRKSERIQFSEASEKEQVELLERHKEISLKQQFQIRDHARDTERQVALMKAKIEPYAIKIQQLKEDRKRRSNELQQRLFREYGFLNILGDVKSVGSIFSEFKNELPPAGAGECAAPKLLHYAFKHQMTPLALGEFWWGQSPSSEIRKHKQFYPSCRGKCEPILSHMLQGMKVDPNPMESGPEIDKMIEIVYEDEDIAVINKPHELLSIPGKLVRDSVEERMKRLFPQAEGPMIVHRLDMSTSGIMLVAKNLKSFHVLQQQFIKRTLKKMYVARLASIPSELSGTIDLPLRVDLDDRPRQMVCYEHGKEAITHWEIESISDGKAKVRFYPVTGRTHQLRVHAAHLLGLNCPIEGDDIYGHKGDRLYLHAQEITFRHPAGKQQMTIRVEAPF